jgi:hypothetical protein
VELHSIQQRPKIYNTPQITGWEEFGYPVKEIIRKSESDVARTGGGGGGRKKNRPGSKKILKTNLTSKNQKKNCRIKASS